MESKVGKLPIEERTHKDFYPDLSLQKRLQIYDISPENKELIHQFYVQDPIPKLQVTFTKPVQKPEFSIIHDLKSNLDIPPFYRHIEPTEQELFERVEYDMDEQDRQWLLCFNQRLSKQGIKDCSMDFFEFIMDQLEKEWFDLVKDIPKQSAVDVQYPEDITCAVCDDGEAENTNAIVFCDGCNLAVHQDCYGVPFIPEGQWLCRRCMISPGLQVQCVLCPNDGGAFKQTNTNKWAHLTCAMWVPECQIQNTVFMEPIEGIELIPKSRWKLTCYICHKKHGAPIQCSVKNCFTAFHPTCGKRAKLYMKMRGQGQDSQDFRGFCDRHAPKDYREIVNVDACLKNAREELTKPGRTKLVPVKKKRKSGVFQSAKVYHPRKKVSLASPIVPNYILDRIMSSENEIMKKKDKQVVIGICKYWSLKKESLMGAALLKRLHLEPWTASISASKEEDEALAFIRKDLEKVRLLLDMVRKRERMKLRICKTQLEIFQGCLHPLSKVLKTVLEKCKKYYWFIRLDKLQIFAEPVNAEEVIDYYTVIKNPMDFRTMSEKLERNEYQTYTEFEDDVMLICENCKLYNKPETIFAKTAIRLQIFIQTMAPTIKAEIVQSGLDIDNGGWKAKVPSEIIDSFKTFAMPSRDIEPKAIESK